MDVSHGGHRTPARSHGHGRSLRSATSIRAPATSACLEFPFTVSTDHVSPTAGWALGLQHLRLVVALSRATRPPRSARSYLPLARIHGDQMGVRGRSMVLLRRRAARPPDGFALRGTWYYLDPLTGAMASWLDQGAGHRVLPFLLRRDTHRMGKD